MFQVLWLFKTDQHTTNQTITITAASPADHLSNNPHPLHDQDQLGNIHKDQGEEGQEDHQQGHKAHGGGAGKSFKSILFMKNTL